METPTTEIVEWEQRPWGAFLTVHSDPHVTVKRLWVKPRSSLSLQYHLHRDEFWTPTELPTGRLRFVIGEEILTAEEGVVYSVPRGTKHRIVNESTVGVEVLEVAKGHFDENDIVRLEDNYGRKTV